MDTSMQPVINAFAQGMWSIVLPLAIIGILLGSFFGFVVFLLRKHSKK